MRGIIDEGGLKQAHFAPCSGFGWEAYIRGPGGDALLQAALEGAGITQFLRIAIEDELTTGRLVIILPELRMSITPVHVLDPFGRQLPLRARVFIDFSSRKSAAFLQTDKQTTRLANCQTLLARPNGY